MCVAVWCSAAAGDSDCKSGQVMAAHKCHASVEAACAALACTKTLCVFETGTVNRVRCSAAPNHAVLQGSSCNGLGEHIALKNFIREGGANVWTARPGLWGCGCPKGDDSVWALVYEPKTSPLLVRACRQIAAQPQRCPPVCNSWFDLTVPLQEAKTNEVILVRP